MDQRSCTNYNIIDEKVLRNAIGKWNSGHGGLLCGICQLKVVALSIIVSGKVLLGFIKAVSKTKHLLPTLERLFSNLVTVHHTLFLQILPARTMGMILLNYLLLNSLKIK